MNFNLQGFGLKLYRILDYNIKKQNVDKKKGCAVNL